MNMSEMKLPKFKSDEEEADFWDRVDTTQILEEGEEIEVINIQNIREKVKRCYFCKGRVAE